MTFIVWIFMWVTKFFEYIIIWFLLTHCLNRDIKFTFKIIFLNKFTRSRIEKNLYFFITSYIHVILSYIFKFLMNCTIISLLIIKIVKSTSLLIFQTILPTILNRLQHIAAIVFILVVLVMPCDEFIKLILV